VPNWDKVCLSFFVDYLVYLGVLMPPLVMRVLFDYAYPNRDLNMLFIFACIPFVLTLFFNALLVLKSFIDLYVNQHLVRSLYNMFYSKIQRLPIRFFHTNRVGDLIYKMTDDLHNIEQTVVFVAPAMVREVLKIVVLFAIAFSINPILTMLAVFGVPIYYAQTHFFAKQLRLVQHERQDMNANIYSLIEERLSNMKLIKLFHQWVDEVQRLLRQISSLFFIERKYRVTSSVHNLVSTFMEHMWMLGVGLYTGYCVISGIMSLGEAVAMTTYIVMLRRPFIHLAGYYKQLVLAQVSFQRIALIMEQSVECPEDAEVGQLMRCCYILWFDF